MGLAHCISLPLLPNSMWLLLNILSYKTSVQLYFRQFVMVVFLWFCFNFDMVMEGGNHSIIYFTWVGGGWAHLLVPLEQIFGWLSDKLSEQSTEFQLMWIFETKEYRGRFAPSGSTYTTAFKTWAVWFSGIHPAGRTQQRMTPQQAKPKNKKRAHKNGIKGIRGTSISGDQGDCTIGTQSSPTTEGHPRKTGSQSRPI